MTRGDFQLTGQVRWHPVHQGDRPTPVPERNCPGVHGLPFPAERQFHIPAGIPAGIAPGILRADTERHRRIRADHARGDHDQLLRTPRHDVDGNVRHDRRAPGSAERIAVAAEAEALLHEGLHPGTGTAVTAVAHADDDVITRFQITVHGVHDDGLLEGPLMTFLVESHLEGLDRCRTLSGNTGPRMVFRGHIVRSPGIRGLEKCPVRVELERRLEPGTVCHSGRTNLIVQDDFGPLAGHQPVDVAGDISQERHVLGFLVKTLRSEVITQAFVQFLFGHLFHCGISSARVTWGISEFEPGRA